jgi:hypothetical protein
MHDRNLNRNKLTGPIPPELMEDGVGAGVLVGLTQLWLSSNNLTGPISPSISELTALKSLLLNDNLELSSTIPTGIALLVALTVLELDDNSKQRECLV